MSRESLVFVVGFLVFLVPFLSIPRDFKEYFFIAAGVVLMIVGFSLRRLAFFRSIEDESGERSADAFSERVADEDTEMQGNDSVDDETV